MIIPTFSQYFTGLLFLIYVTCKPNEYHLNSPPTIYVDRKWVLPDDTPVGTLVKKIEAADVENDALEYGLEHSSGFNIVQSDAQPLPFKIDRKLGYVYTNRSLLELGGQNIYMYVTVNDGHQTSKLQVWIQIENSSVSEVPVGSTYFRPQISFSNNGISQSTLIFSGNEKVPVPFNTNTNPKQPTKLNSIDVKKNIAYPVSDTTIISTSVLPSSTENEINLPGSKNKESNTKDNTTLPKSQFSNITKSKDIELNFTREPSNRIIVILLPMLMIIVSLVVSTVVACWFRKKICRKLKKVKADDFKKSTCTETSFEESVTLQHWIPRIQEGRCDTYDTESNHTQSTLISGNERCKQNDKWEFPRHHIKVFNILGEGCFGQVWKCEALNINNKEGTTVVAVKMLKENAGERERLDLLQELHVMKMLDPHPNVVRLLGCCSDKEPTFVIMEYVSNGKLQSYLRHSRAQRYYDNMYGASNTLTSRDLISFCYQIAKGMQYLSLKGIIHRDLAARNILITEEQTCKVADFGFARDLMSNHIYERKSDGRLPIRWMSPESLYDNTFSVKSDIWSYGVLVWEIVTLGSTPYPGISAAEVMRRVRDGYRLEKPEHCHRELYNIMYYCWDKDAKERPNFTELVDLLEQLLLTEMDYIQLERFPDHSYYNIISLSGEKL